MRCIKTGCHAYSEEYGEYLYGDLFHDSKSGCWAMRVCQRSYQPIHDLINARFSNISQWWDKERTSPQQNSTLITFQTGCYYSYEGRPR